MPSELVGDTGFEPVTSSVSARSNHAPDLPECTFRQVRGVRCQPLKYVRRCWSPLTAPTCSPTFRGRLVEHQTINPWRHTPNTETVLPEP